MLFGCRCARMPAALKADDHPGFFNDLQPLAAEDYVCLRRCARCGQHWAVDEWDKYQISLASKVAAAELPEWRSQHRAAQLDWLLRHRGPACPGQACAQAGCRQDRLRSAAFCLEHLYAAGERE